ncbi:hypothetical protein MKEN_00316300 [Mycena kentingensis (nom. inval.)]|nr:hypothetical protein MKEN_00316300 [Mycena kentingensis (nom. inval.)]
MVQSRRHEGIMPSLAKHASSLHPQQKMRFQALLAASLALLVSAVPRPRTISSNHGTITSPIASTLIANSGSIPFAYADSNWCHDGYSSVSVYLLDFEPTTANIDADTGLFADAEVIAQLGTYLIPNFGLSPLPPPSNPPPPSTLTIPDLSSFGYQSGTAMYLTVVETATACPPVSLLSASKRMAAYLLQGLNIPPQYGVTSVRLVIA